MFSGYRFDDTTFCNFIEYITWREFAMSKFFVCIPKDICDPKDVKTFFRDSKSEVEHEIIKFESQEDCFKEYVHDFSSFDGFDNRFFYLFEQYLFDVSKDEDVIKEMYLSNVNQFFKHSPHLRDEYIECSKTEVQMSDELLYYIRKNYDGWSSWIIQEYDISEAK